MFSIRISFLVSQGSRQPKRSFRYRAGPGGIGPCGSVVYDQALGLQGGRLGVVHDRCHYNRLLDARAIGLQLGVAW